MVIDILSNQLKHLPLHDDPTIDDLELALLVLLLDQQRVTLMNLKKEPPTLPIIGVEPFPEFKVSWFLIEVDIQLVDLDWMIKLQPKVLGVEIMLHDDKKEMLWLIRMTKAILEKVVRRRIASKIAMGMSKVVLGH